MRHVFEAAHSLGVSVHSLLVAGFALAIRDLSETDATRILMQSSVDLRRRLAPHLSVDLVMSAVTAHVTAIDDVDQSIFDIAKLAFEDIRAGIEDGRIFRDYNNYPKAFGETRDIPIAINISDMGAVSFHASMAALTATRFEYATALMKNFPNVSISIYDGTLVANTVYIEEFTAPETIGRRSELVIEKLPLCEVS
jgi:hypothetical protein